MTPPTPIAVPVKTVSEANGREWRNLYCVRVYGTPVGQPRARATVRRFGNQVRAGVYDPGTANDWKGDIQRAFRDVVHADFPPIAVPTCVDITVYFPRPKDHYRSGRYAGQLKPNAPYYHTSAPDRDNIDKACLDALVDMGFLATDAVVCAGQAPLKLYVNGECGWKPGAEIRVSVFSPAPAKGVA